MSSKLKQQLELMKIGGEENRNKRTYIPASLLMRSIGEANIQHFEFGKLIESDTFMNIEKNWPINIRMPIILDDKAVQCKLQKIADELKEYAKADVFIIDSLANMMPTERR